MSNVGSPELKGDQISKMCFIDWVPEDLAGDLRDNGAKSWPEVAKILEIEI